MNNNLEDCTLIITSDDIIAIPIKSFIKTLKSTEDYCKEQGVDSEQIRVIRTFYEKALRKFYETTLLGNKT